eukprot:8953131-Prorocentrum_lima.AAC.1
MRPHPRWCLEQSSGATANPLRRWKIPHAWMGRAASAGSRLVGQRPQCGRACHKIRRSALWAA